MIRKMLTGTFAVGMVPPGYVVRYERHLYRVHEVAGGRHLEPMGKAPPLTLPTTAEVDVVAAPAEPAAEPPSCTCPGGPSDLGGIAIHDTACPAVRKGVR